MKINILRLTLLQPVVESGMNKTSNNSNSYGSFDIHINYINEFICRNVFRVLNSTLEHDYDRWPTDQL